MKARSYTHYPFNLFSPLLLLLLLLLLLEEQLKEQLKELGETDLIGRSTVFIKQIQENRQHKANIRLSLFFKNSSAQQSKTDRSFNLIDFPSILYKIDGKSKIFDYTLSILKGNKDKFRDSLSLIYNIKREASCLDAFNTYPFLTWLLYNPKDSLKYKPSIEGLG